MSEERLKEIKDSLNVIYKSYGNGYGKLYFSTHLQQEEELYNEVIRLREENKMIDNLRNANYLSWQDSLSRIEKAINKMQYIMSLGFDYDGFNNADDLKKLIDELVNIAIDSVDILIGENND